MNAPALQEKLMKEILPGMAQKYGYKNKMQGPRLAKVVVNVGTGSSQGTDGKFFDSVGTELAAIAGQKPVSTMAKGSLANFKIRKGMKIGWKVTLRGRRMYEFLHRFIHAAVPQIRDFRGLPTSGFDGRGNYSVGIKEQTIFPEIELDKAVKIHGLDIAVVTTAETDDEARSLLDGLGFPFAGPKSS